jgi:hypothetical protein
MENARYTYSGSENVNGWNSTWSVCYVKEFFDSTCKETYMKILCWKAMFELRSKNRIEVFDNG